jgi:hypothetical protein
MTICTKYDVRSGALASEKIPGLTFIDPRIPRRLTGGGRHKKLHECVRVLLEAATI